MDLKIEDSTLKNYTGHGINSLTIPDTVKEIGSWSLDNHPELYHIILPETVQKIGYHSFYEDTNLTSIIVDRRNKYFAGFGGAAESLLCDKKLTTLLCCPNGLESVHIPASITSMKETDAFAGCSKLKKITVDKNNRKFTVIDDILYEHDGYKLTKLVRCPVDKVSVQIPESVTEIYNHAFENCKLLEEVTIPDHITKLEAYTFKNCYSLKSIHLPKNLKTIGDSCFRYCKSLEEVIFPNGTKDIIAGAFNGCEKLKKVVIPETVTWVGYSFSSCPELEKILCHGIEINEQDLDKNSETASIFVWMIVRKDFEARRLPNSKYRIIYEMFLRNQDNQKINAYIKENFAEIIKILIQENQIQLVQNYMKSFRRYTTAQNLDEFIRFAIDEQKYEIQIFLTNLKYQRNDFTEKDWSL